MTHRPPRVVVTLVALLLVATLGGFTQPRTTKGAATPFVDIAGSMFVADIEWLWSEGITTGCDATHFCPHQWITRAQMASFLVRMFDLPDTSKDYFTDDETSSHEANINRIAAAGITTGCTATTYCPTANVTREQMAAFLRRAFE